MMNEHDYQNIMNRIELSPEKKKHILHQNLQRKHEREYHSMTSFFKRKASLVAIAFTLFLGIPVCATGVITSWSSSSYSFADYRTLPSTEQCIKDVGYAPVLIESFSNGYQFEKGNIVNNSLNDADGNSVEKFQSFSFDYVKGDDCVMFSQDKYQSSMESSGEIVKTINGVDIYYYSYTNKLVPPDYQMTAEDKKAQESGELVFSWGADEVRMAEVQGVSWSIGNMHYGFTQIDGQLTLDALVAMAEEVMQQEK